MGILGESCTNLNETRIGGWYHQLYREFGWPLPRQDLEYLQDVLVYMFYQIHQSFLRMQSDTWNS